MRKVDIIRRDGKRDNIETYTVNDFPYQNLKNIALKCRAKKPKYYLQQFGTFDIETTTIDSDIPYGFMYHWQIDLAGDVITGRTWEEWLLFLDKISEIYGISDDRRLVIYVHNLGYEFQFMRDFLEEHFGGFELFATKSRAPIRVNTKTGIEFRCSYRLTNMSLNKATENEFGVLHTKAIGDLDYRKIRTKDTMLTDIEFGYCVSDVVSLYELIQNRLKNEYDNLESIPMTSTGYVRRDCRKACRKDANYRKNFLKLTISEDTYTLLKEAGRGGNTHANRFLSGRIWKYVDSFDIVSDYPAQMLLRDYPVTKFVPYGDILDMDEFENLLKNYACLFRITLTNVRLKKDIAMPYIPISKCWSYLREDNSTDIHLRLDNGRVLSAPMLRLTVTDIDYKIIMRHYDFDSFAISDLQIAKYGQLPKPIRDTVLDYFKKKTDLKYAIQNTKDTEELENLQYLYAKSKNRLNGIFGMCYTDPVHQEIKINDCGKWEAVTPDITEALEKFMRSRNSFLYYAWGAWVTCWARLHLENLIDITGQDKTIYCDTDSSKAIGVDIKKIDIFNEKVKKLAKEKGAYYDCHGIRYYMGIAEHENKKPIELFKTLGAKKYVYKDEKGLHITISGVAKTKNIKTGNLYAVEELKSIDNFNPGFIFHKAGGVELVYNDNVGIHEITVEGVTMTTASNVAMLDSTYTIGITGEYAELIGYDIYHDINKEMY